MMMKRIAASTIVAMAALLGAQSLHAQSDTSAPAQTEYVLRVDNGRVMTSRGGDFVDAQTGQVVLDGDRMTLCEGARATIVYANNCTIEYTVPGCYIVQRNCGVVAAPWGGAGRAAGIIGGAALLGAVLLASGGGDNENDPPPPLSR